MIRNILTGLFASLAFFLSTQSQAQTHTIGATGISISSYNISSTQSFVGQRFVSPAGSTNLTQFTMAALTSGTRTVMEPQIHVVTNGGANSSGLGLTTDVVWTGPQISVTIGPPLAYTFELNSPLELDPSKIYVLGLAYVSDDSGGVSSSIGNDYAFGNLLGLVPAGLRGETVDLYFEARFETLATPVPTLSEWALILFGGCIASLAAWSIYRRRQAQA